MQYDENGYPMKGSNQNQQPREGSNLNYNTAAYAGSPTNAAPQHQQIGNANQQHQQPVGSAAPSNGPMYDERGYPVKPQQQQQYQQQQPQYAAGAGVPAYAGGNASPYEQQQIVPQQQSAAYPNQQQPHHTQQEYDERGYPVKRQQPPPQQQNHQGSPLQQQQQQAYYPPVPQEQPQFSSVIGSPRQAERNYWTTGLCDIFADCDVCLEGCCCLCCQEGRLFEAVHNGRANDMSALICCLLCLCVNWYPCVDLMNRRKLVEKYNIQDEGCLTSAVFSCCCPPLSACQMHREMQARGIYPGGTCCAKSCAPAPPNAYGVMGSNE